MNQEYQLLTLTATQEQSQALAEAFRSCGFLVNYIDDNPGYAFDPNSVSTIIVAIVGAGGIGALIKSVVDIYRTKLDIKLGEDGKISEIKINSAMNSEDLLHFIEDIKMIFGNHG